jgi:hypothetical protein
LFLPMQAELLTDQEREWLALPPVPQGDWLGSYKHPVL